MMAGKGPVSHYISWVYMLLIVTCSWDWSIYPDKVHHGIRWNAFNNLILVEVLICMIRWEGSHNLPDWGFWLLASAKHGWFHILSTRSTNIMPQPKLFRSTWQCWLRHMQILVTCWTHISSDTTMMNITWIAQKNWLRSSRWISRCLKSWRRMGKKSFSRWMCYARWYKR